MGNDNVINNYAMRDGRIRGTLAFGGYAPTIEHGVKRVHFARDIEGSEAYVMEIEFQDGVRVSAKEIAQFVLDLNLAFQELKPNSAVRSE
jgi:hypothetical protein